MLANEMNSLARSKKEEEFERKRKLYAADISRVEDSIRECAQAGKFLYRFNSIGTDLGGFLKEYFTREGFSAETKKFMTYNGCVLCLDIRWENNIHV